MLARNAVAAGRCSTLNGCTPWPWIGGVATDKLLAHEKSQTDDGTPYLSELEKAAARFAGTGKSLELRVFIGPTTPGADAIDVTPKGGNGPVRDPAVSTPTP